VRAGFPGGEGFPELNLITTRRRNSRLVVANIYKTVLGIQVNVTTKVLGHRGTSNMEFDMRLGGSGVGYDPDDGVVDWMNQSKFSGRTRDREISVRMTRLGRTDALIRRTVCDRDLEQHEALVQKASQITSDKLAGFPLSPVDVQVRHKSSVPASRIPVLHGDRVTLSQFNTFPGRLADMQQRGTVH
jgi:hypothetical protein